MKPKPPYALFWKDKDMADTKKKTGLYFGSFNPVHAGHLIVAEHIAWHTDLDQVWLVVSPHNPFKEKSSLASDYDRLEMVNLAIEGYDRLRACDAEFRLPKPSYTCDTLIHLSEKYPSRDFSLIVGADSLIGFERWKNYDFILKYFSLYIYPRPGYENTSPVIEGSRFKVIEGAPQVEVSASAIRRDIALGRSVKALVPPAVLSYMEKNGLYR